MKLSFAHVPLMAIVVLLSFQSCKSKKAALAAKPAEPEVETVEKPVEKPAEAPTEAVVRTNTERSSPINEEKLAFNFKNIQFEFNSAVLKTASYRVLDEVSMEMKKAPSTKFTINGHSSAEGSPEHNKTLSLDRANAVKSYLINAGIDGANLSVKGFGESMPIAGNSTESQRALNRRVEIKTNK